MLVAVLRSRHKAGLLAMALVLLVMVGGGVWVALQVKDSGNPVRLRNALLAQLAEPGELDWSPLAPPGDYLLEHVSPPAEILQAYQKLGLPDDADSQTKALAIARHLAAKPRRGGALMSNTVDSHRRILAEGNGYCADYTQVFLGLAQAAGLGAREWGISFGRLGTNGHAFVEFYEEDSGRWIFLDPFYRFYAVDAVSGESLSAFEFMSAVEGDRPLPRLLGLDQQDLSPEVSERRMRFYGRGIQAYYLWWGDNVFSYFDHPVVRWLTPVSRPLEQLAAILFGLHPEIRIPGLDGNQREVSALLRLKSGLYTVLLVELIGAVLLITLLLTSFRGLRSKRGRRRDQ